MILDSEEQRKQLLALMLLVTPKGTMGEIQQFAGQTWNPMVKAIEEASITKPAVVKEKAKK